MIRIFLTILLFSLVPAEGFADSRLIRLSRIETGEAVQLLAFFDQRPRFEQQLHGRRLDLIAVDTVVATSLDVPVPDDDIVKTVVSQDQKKTIISFYFRYHPQELRVRSGPAETLVVELRPGNRFTSTYRELTTRLGQLDAVDRTSSTLINPLTVSAYAPDWKSFFETDLGHFFIELPPRFHFPPFPLTTLLKMQSSAFDEFSIFLDGLNPNDWFPVLTQVQQKLKSSNDDEQSRYLALAHADVLYRLGNMDAAYEQFELLKQAYGEDQVGLVATYAQALINAHRGNIYQTHLVLQSLSDIIGDDNPLAELIGLSLLESSLATGDLLTAEPFFINNEPQPGAGGSKWDLRRADLHFASGLHQQALGVYDELFGTVEFDAQPYSLNAYCTLLYQQERFRESSRCYRRLSPRLENDNDRAAALYLETLAAGQSENGTDLISQLDSIARQFPGSEAAARAALKRADLCIVQELTCSDDAREVYRHHAQTAISRQLAQEASFKAALQSYLAGDENEAVELLQLTRRNFRSGPLQNEVLALTVEALPKSMRRLLNNQQDIEAISQAQQNRDLFHNGWIDSPLLYELGLAFERLNLGDEAFAVFLYLYNLQTFGDDEELLSSLTRLAHAREDVGLVDDFGEQYLSRYPAGRYRLDVLYWLIDSNFSDGQTELAARLLPEELPDRKDFKILAAAIGLSQGRHEEVTEILSPLYEKEDLPLTSRFMLAESLFALGRVDLSEEIYRELADTGDFRDTSLYRLSVIARRNDNEPQSRALLERLRTETGSSQWLQFVKQEIRLRQLVSQL